MLSWWLQAWWVAGSLDNVFVHMIALRINSWRGLAIKMLNGKWASERPPVAYRKKKVETLSTKDVVCMFKKQCQKTIVLQCTAALLRTQALSEGNLLHWQTEQIEQSY